MQQADAEWDNCGAQRSRRKVDGPHQAIGLCNEIEARGVDHLLVSFTSQEGVFFAIGLGASNSCAMFWKSADPPYYQSRGNAAPDGDAVTYWYGGQPSEMPASVTISRSDAKAALAEFMTTGRRPENIAWDET